MMTNVTLADAKAHLSEVVTPRAPVALSALRELTASMPAQSESAADFIRGIRDDSRY